MNLRKLSLMLCVTASPAMAQLANQEGISGEIAITAGFASSTSNFNTEGSDTISSSNQKPTSEYSFLAFPLGSITYTFGDALNQQAYTGTSRQDVATGIVVLEVGYRYQFESRMIMDIAILPTIMSSETWENPYLVNQSRTKTDESGNAFRFQLKNIAGSNFSLDSAFATKEIDTDKVVDELKRDANTIYLKGQYRQPLSRTMLVMPSIIYQSSSADGKANSYDQYGVELSVFKLMQRHQIVLTAGYAQRQYESTNPIYDKTRENNKLSLFAAYEYKNIMDWKDWSLVAFAGYGAEQSNITFYDNSEYIISTGLNYKF
ncbi:DUF2860 domain-containing protein [Aliivibrio fischeri]|uniref:DUF2860 domain-containing protein n=1 Tax=Aliivibrio fischeri TaxID=668 RepID=UPI0012DAB449|nr:DUF2860 domain-containing protein [Aliivibrio fischeri]MUK69641.1 DUF2860 domain-containing protein [Aliivibrio fischeri]MUK73530.1 DUF2860 domain-containing protein [Aliivibrio fischeri]